MELTRITDMARPTLYNQETVDKAWAYAKGEWETVYDHAVPSVVGLCQAINRSRSVIYNWANDTEKEFVDILAYINEQQEIITFTRSLRGDYNATIAKLLLGKHGYHDKQDNTLSGPDGKAIETDNKYTIEFVNADSNPIINASCKDK